MARKLCEFCNTRPAVSTGNASITACLPCDEEAGWENTHSDSCTDENPTAGCWFCYPELNRARDTYVKQERKGHHSPRRPQINHRACNHAQTPLARRTCRKAYWAEQAKLQAEEPGRLTAAQELLEPVALTAQYEGTVTWTSTRGRAMFGTIAKDLGAGKVQILVAGTKKRYVQVGFASLSIPATS